MKATVIASRDQLCINPKLKGKSNIDKAYMCQQLVKRQECPFKSGVRRTLYDPEAELDDNQIVDIEDLVSIGKQHHCCPYYLSQELGKGADIIFIPYNYLLDPKIRELNQITLKNAIVIFDEAHNLENVCEQSASTFITSIHIRKAIRNINHVINIQSLFLQEYFCTK